MHKGTKVDVNKQRNAINCVSDAAVIKGMLLGKSDYNALASQQV